MQKPYVICHMMTSIDGRIDCGMTAKLRGVDEYYATLRELNADAFLSGRVTAKLELADQGEFQSGCTEILGCEQFSKKAEGPNSVVVDTHGTLLWKSSVVDERPLIVICCKQVKKAYLEYLDNKGISWIVCGKERIDLARACEILLKEFGVKRLAVVGGGAINASFLAAGLLDEISLLQAPGIDGRGGMSAVFDGLPQDCEPAQLKLTGVKQFANGSLWLRYGFAD